MDRRFILTLIRHLPTQGNQKKQYIGWTDESILPIQDLNVRLPWDPRIVYGSDLKRCVESAQAYFPNAHYQSDERLRESFFGAWEGKTYEMLKENKQYRNWIDDPTTSKPPQGESLHDVEQRVIAAIQDLPQHTQHHFIISHGGPIRLLLTKFSPEESDFWSWKISHGSVWRLEWESVEAFKEGKRCVSLSAVPTTEKKPM